MKYYIFFISFLLTSCNSNTSTPPPQTTSTETTTTDSLKKTQIKPIVNSLDSIPQTINDTSLLISPDVFATYEFHRTGELKIKIIKKSKDNTNILIPEFYAYGLFDTILVQDYNFDNKLDIDVVTRPANRSGANACHNIYLYENGQYNKAKTPQYSFFSPSSKNKHLYAIYNGNCDFELIKGYWLKDSLIIDEKISLYCTEDYESYSAITKNLIGDTLVEIKTDTITDFPEEYVNQLSESILY